MNWLATIKPALPTAGLVLAIGSFMAILGPYQSYQFGWPLVWFYWTGLIALGWVSGFLIGRVMERLALPSPQWVTYALASFLVSIPITIAVIIIQHLMGRGFPLAEFPVIFGLVWVISIAITGLTWLLDARKAEQGEAQMGRALADKLPPRLRRAQLLALQSEDHYLRVHTDAGDELILMRLSDAVAALETLDGARTHRSWWVSRSAVDSASRSDGRAVLTLSNGLEVPVSRTYSPRLREAGWY